MSNSPSGETNAPGSPHPPPQQHARPPLSPASQPHYQQAPPHQQQHQQQPQQQQQQQPTSQEVLDSNKRAALAGQWRTPPLPVFPTSAPPQYQHQHGPPPQHQHQQPPAPAAPQSQPQQQPPPPAQQAGLPPPTNLPHNSEDYAKALQEAYRRGAEAAAAMAAQQQHITPSVSCPNFQMSMAPAPPPPPQQPPAHEQQPIATSRSEKMNSSSTHQYAHAPAPPQGHTPYHTQYSDPNLVTHHNHAPPHQQQPPAPHHAPPQQHHQHHAQQQQQQQQHHQPPPQQHQYAQQHPPAYGAPGPAPQAAQAPAQAPGVPNPLTNMPPPPPKQPTQTVPQPPAAPPSTQIVVPPPQQRSVSLPDMSTYAVQAEEEKRQKRLARNRASARLRRLGKKNLVCFFMCVCVCIILFVMHWYSFMLRLTDLFLTIIMNFIDFDCQVDAYETEVGILEKTLQQLKAHEWGVPTSGTAADANINLEKSHQSLLEALCMDRGQQVISSEQRAQQCQDILEQQLEQMELLRQVQFEQQLLAATAGVGENKDDDDAEMAQMAQELNEVLGLSDDQKSQLQGGSNGLDEEMTALDTVFSSLVMMKENEWLLNQGVQDITDQLTSILHKNQMSKFLLWADANVEAIDQLDHVHAAPKTAPHPQGPIFTFGVETTPMEGDEDGK